MGSSKGSRAQSLSVCSGCGTNPTTVQRYLGTCPYPRDGGAGSSTIAMRAASLFMSVLCLHTRSTPEVCVDSSGKPLRGNPQDQHGQHGCERVPVAQRPRAGAHGRSDDRRSSAHPVRPHYCSPRRRMRRGTARGRCLPPTDALALTRWLNVFSRFTRPTSHLKTVNRLQSPRDGHF